MSAVMTAPRPSLKASAERARGWINPLNLHFAGVGLLTLICVYLLVHMAFLWQRLSSNDTQALAQQRIALKTAEISADPLRGLDNKLDRATSEADRFYATRLPSSDSQVLAELGALTKKNALRYSRAQYLHAPVLAGTTGELTELRIDASLTGDYRPLIEVINALERDKLFFVIYGVQLTGQQTGAVNLRLSLTTYLRGHVPQDDARPSDTNPDGASIDPAAGTPPSPVTPTAGGRGR